MKSGIKSKKVSGKKPQDQRSMQKHRSQQADAPSKMYKNNYMEGPMMARNAIQDRQLNQIDEIREKERDELTSSYYVN